VLVWLVVTALAFWLLYWVVALGIAIAGAVLVGVVALAADCDEHSTYEEREMVRAAKRKAKYDRNAGARARDRERWEAHQARQAERPAER
jgi:hypothetical protein